jgi:mitogen-activated protein kinase kinase
MAPPATKPAGKKRPPPMNLKPKAAADAAASDTVSDNLLAVAPGPTSAPATANTSTNLKRMTYHTTLSNTLANLDLNAEVKYDLRDEDLKDLNELGQGNGGSVKKVEHVPTHTIMAKKVPFVPLSLCCRARAHFVSLFATDRPHRREAIRAQTDPA